nr:pre-toxin TG domain-containing protein [Chloroflexaceae bacterium]
MDVRPLLRQRQQGSSTVEMAGLAMAVALLILGLVLVLRAKGGVIGNSLVQVYVCNITGMGCGSGGSPVGSVPPGGTRPGSQPNGTPVTPAPAPTNNGPSAVQQGGSVALDVIPIVGEIKGFIEVFTGRDLVTGEDLGHWRWAGLLGIVGLNEVRFLRYGDDVADAFRRGDDVADAARRSDDLPDWVPCRIGGGGGGGRWMAMPAVQPCTASYKADGTFDDDSLEMAYQDYVARKQGAGDTPRDRADWLERREFYTNLERGNAFNRSRASAYDYNEVHLQNGKRLDSYDPVSGEIVSRKATTFDNIQESTFRSYLQELKTKYPPGTTIRSNKYPDIDGDTLQGR